MFDFNSNIRIAATENRLTADPPNIPRAIHAKIIDTLSAIIGGYGSVDVNTKYVITNRGTVERLPRIICRGEIPTYRGSFVK